MVVVVVVVVVVEVVEEPPSADAVEVVPVVGVVVGVINNDFKLLQKMESLLVWSYNASNNVVLNNCLE